MNTSIDFFLNISCQIKFHLRFHRPDRKWLRSQQTIYERALCNNCIFFWYTTQNIYTCTIMDSLTVNAPFFSYTIRKIYVGIETDKKKYESSNIGNDSYSFSVQNLNIARKNRAGKLHHPQLLCIDN